MKILLTNDDGYNAEGIKILFDKLKKYGDVIMVAPHHHMSGTSMSRAFHDKLQVIQHEENLYSVTGTPADAVVMALYALNIRPDVVISGINNGFNVSTDTTYSGTIGAAMEAIKAGIPAIAFSSDWDDFSHAKKDLDYVMNFILNKDLLSSKYVLNVNFIRKTIKKTKGIRITDLGFRPTEYYYVKEGDYYVAKRRHLEYEPEEETDIHAIRNGYISITPLKYGNQTEYGLRELRNKVSRSE
ncbi:MAG: 5'/3'-nucleotidase SurE [Bacilli bacterium]|nr:5'/3'-nucleotidase SurE [Bacilli bacterium]MBN2877099.1 5'/3'-nucleotidase SurE [Bacilli bacterium]